MDKADLTIRLPDRKLPTDSVAFVLCTRCGNWVKFSRRRRYCPNCDQYLESSVFPYLPTARNSN
jgi:hypothetical protein